MTDRYTTPQIKTVSVRKTTEQRKREKRYTHDLHVLVSPEQHKFLSRHGIFAIGRNIRHLVDQAMEKENVYISELPCIYGDLSMSARTTAAPKTYPSIFRKK